MTTASSKKNVLVILTSHGTIDKLDKPTGWYLPELAHPYHVLKDHVNFTFASPAGGVAPLDPGSKEAFASDEQCVAFLASEGYQRTLTTTKLVDLTLEQINHFDAVFFPGGHGPMYDLAKDPISQAIVTDLYESGKYVAAVCHGPAAIVNVRLSNGEYLVTGRIVTGFTNTEEDMVQLSDAMPFLLETSLVALGATFTKAAEPWGCCTVVDGNLITGQNPASSSELGEKLLQLLSQ
jgi:putative intracellular protease/amidase